MIKSWLNFFRVVNLPTVPGDVWVGAVAAWTGVGIVVDYGCPLFNATVAGVALYMFGLADNDIVGAKTDRGRPLSDGLITMTAARAARALCLVLAIVAGVVPDPVAAVSLPPLWWMTACALLMMIVVYNRTGSWLAMGLCRGLNVACGGAVAMGMVLRYPECTVETMKQFWALWLAVFVWTAYIAAVTKYSEGEEMDAAKKRRVGFLVGAIVYLQIVALLLAPSGIVVLVGVLLVVMRLMKRFLPEVSAS